MTANERLDGSYLRNVFQMSNLHMNIFKFSTNQGAVGKVLAKHGPLLNGLCEEHDRGTPKKMSKINVDIRQYKVLQLGKPREQLKDEICPEAVYDQKAAKKKKARDEAAQQRSHRGNVRVFGYKHPKVMRFMALLIRCLKDCMEQKHDQLNLDMNNFLLLKNELSLTFLRNMDNIIATVKSAIKLYAT